MTLHLTRRALQIRQACFALEGFLLVLPFSGNKADADDDDARVIVSKNFSSPSFTLYEGSFYLLSNVEVRDSNELGTSNLKDLFPYPRHMHWLLD